MMDGVVEIITGRERRRRWSVEEKLRIVAETQEAGARVSAVAARNGLCESLVFAWRRQVREGILVRSEAPVFLPVRTLEVAAPATAEPSLPRAMSQSVAARSASPSGLMEIELGDGRRVRVGSDVNLAALRRVLRALRQ
ncbi:MAG TPA: transposase [Acetobacteraceae bacterium]|jgi:transposase|nr:transposase [Acetobacteraceae bacterium]